MEEAPPEDNRLPFLGDYVLKTLKLKEDKWQKCVTSEESRPVLQDFLDSVEQQSLLICVSAGGQLQAAAGLSTIAPSKSKAVYFVKRGQVALTADTMRDKLVCGDLSAVPLEQFTRLVEVTVLLLSFVSNQTEWPQVVTEEVVHHVHSLKNSVHVVSGQVQGKTLLPLPVDFEKLVDSAPKPEKRGGEVERCIIHSLESVVIEWSHHISVVLKKDSSEALLEGKNPTPHKELLFWKNRHADLKGVHSQLTSRHVIKMGILLESVESSYSPVFKNMQQDVQAALEEACFK